jgi:exonuclease SbcD
LRIAITADNHLTSYQDHPERYHALENILGQIISDQIQNIIIAGDLFDEVSQNYIEFDNICKDQRYKEINFIIIPGNHDSQISEDLFTAKNINIINEPQIRSFDSTGLKFLFIPFQKKANMGEYIAPFASDLPHNQWILIGHGDWSKGLHEPNPCEPGVYMPLTRTDIELYKPAEVILGHIHKPIDEERVHYVGSPCGLDITETGYRRFLVIDTDIGSITSPVVNTDVIFFNESLTILPLRDEKEYLKNQIEAKISRWNLWEADKSKVRIQLKIQGYTSNRNELMEMIQKLFGEYAFYNDKEPDTSNIFVSKDIELSDIASRAFDRIEEVDWFSDGEQPEKDQVLMEALKVLYGD